MFSGSLPLSFSFNKYIKELVIKSVELVNCSLSNLKFFEGLKFCINSYIEIFIRSFNFSQDSCSLLDIESGDCNGKKLSDKISAGELSSCLAAFILVTSLSVKSINSSILP